MTWKILARWFGKKRTRLRAREELEAALGLKITNEAYFVEALTHRSALSRVPSGARNSNERLEFLGDSVLGLLVAETLFERFPELDEGQMTRLRSLLVNQHALAEKAAAVSLSRFLSMSNSAQQTIEKGYETIISDAFEAVIAAIYLDGGLESARRFVLAKVIPADLRIDGDMFESLDRNFKSALLEFAQGIGLGAPRYNLIKEEGPDHDRTFTVEVIVNETPYGIGSGKTKKAAEQAAAGEAYERLRSERSTD